MREHNQPSLFFPDPAIEHVCVDDEDEEEEADERGPNGYEG